MEAQVFRKRPVEIQAVQWTSPEAAHRLVEWSGRIVRYDPHESGPCDPETGQDWGRLAVDTLEGRLLVSPRDWVVRGVEGEFYACKPLIFEATYERVTD